MTKNIMKPILLFLLFASQNTLAWDQKDGFMKPNDKELKKRLTAEQYTATQQEGTEPLEAMQHMGKSKP